MKAYGIPRVQNAELHCDVVAARTFAQKTRLAGNKRSAVDGSAKKRHTRRVYKSTARQQGKALCRQNY